MIGGAAAAQDWATRDLCDVTDPVLDLSEFASSEQSDLLARAAAIPNGVGRFWEIRAPDGAISHLWGTFHSSHRLMLNLPLPVTEAARTARVVALELDPVAPTRAALIERATEYDPYLGVNLRGYPETNNFHDILGPELLGWINARLESLGWGPDAASFLKPEIVAEILLTAPCDDFAYGTYPIQDSYIQLLGYMSGARILGLEPIDALRQTLTKQENRALLFDMIRLYGWALDPMQTPRDTANAFALYLSGQNALAMQLERLKLQHAFGNNRGPDIQRRVDAYLLDARNRDFAAAAETDLQRGGVFMAIGSWHLPGEAGMVALLRARGYTVTRIPTPGEAE